MKRDGARLPDGPQGASGPGASPEREAFEALVDWLQFGAESASRRADEPEVDLVLVGPRGAYAVVHLDAGGARRGDQILALEHVVIDLTQPERAAGARPTPLIQTSGPVATRVLSSLLASLGRTRPHRLRAARIGGEAEPGRAPRRPTERIATQERRPARTLGEP